MFRDFHSPSMMCNSALKVLFVLLTGTQTIFGRRTSHHVSVSPNFTHVCDGQGDVLNTGKNRSIGMPPLIRLVANNQMDYNEICAMIEFRGLLHVHYKTEANETRCHTIAIDVSNVRQSLDTDRFDLSLQNITASNSIASSANDGDHRHNTDEKARTELHFTTSPACCTKFLRCFSIPLSTEFPNEPTFNWSLNFTWLRSPESYEFGEEGWSSVGAPIGSLSGVYDLVRIQLTYVISPESGFQVENSSGEILTVISDERERFQARVGDYFECLSQIDFVLNADTKRTQEFLNEYVPADQFVLNPSLTFGEKVVLSLLDVRSQAFADINLPEFTGASVVCNNDTSHDGTLSIAVGLSICALVLLVLFGLAVSRLKTKDREFKLVENEG